MFVVKLHYVDAVVDAIAHIHVKPPRLTKPGFVAGGAAVMLMASGLALAIGLHFHYHAPEQHSFVVALHQ